MNDKFELNPTNAKELDDLIKALHDLKDKEQQVFYVANDEKVTVQRNDAEFVVRQPDMNGLFVTNGSADKVAHDMMALGGGRISPVINLDEKLIKSLESLVENEHRNYQLGNHGDQWNVQKRDGSYVVRDQNINGIIQSVGDVKSVAADMMQYGQGNVKVEANRWKSTELSLKDTLKSVEGFPSNATAELLNLNLSRYRLVGNDRFEFQLKGQDKIQSMKLDHPPHMSKEIKDMALEQAARNISAASKQMDFTLGG